MSHSAGKCKKGDPFGFINIHSVAKFQKTRRGTLWGQLKIFEKKSHSAEKIQRGGGKLKFLFIVLRVQQCSACLRVTFAQMNQSAAILAGVQCHERRCESYSSSCSSGAGTGASPTWSFPSSDMRSIDGAVGSTG